MFKTDHLDFWDGFYAGAFVMGIVLAIFSAASASAEEMRTRESHLVSKMLPYDIFLFIPPVQDKQKNLGITEYLLRNAAELSLRRNNMPLATSPIRENEDGMPLAPWISVFLNSFEADGQCVFHVTVQADAVGKIGNGDVHVEAWERGTLGTAPKWQCPSLVKNSVQDMMDQFSLVYLKEKRRADERREASKKTQ